MAKARRISLAVQLSKNVKRIRGEKSQLQFAKETGITKSTLNRIESCKQNITIKMLETLCEKMDCSVLDLFKND